MRKVCLINPLSSAHAEFANYFQELIFDCGVESFRVGEMISRKSSPTIIELVLSAFKRSDVADRLRIARYTGVKIYLFVDPFTVLDVLFSFFNKSRIIVFVHERRVYGTSISSRIKNMVYKFILSRCILVGPSEAFKVNLLFGKPLDNCDKDERLVLCFGNWIHGKIGEAAKNDLLELKKMGYFLVRMGSTAEKEVLEVFDWVEDRYISNDEKDKIFRRAKYLFLPYRPTNQSGVMIDCLNYRVRVILSGEGIQDDYPLREMAGYLSEIEDFAEFDFQGQYDKIHVENFVGLTRALLESGVEVSDVR